MGDDLCVNTDNIIQHIDNVVQHSDNVAQHIDNMHHTQQGTDDEQYIHVQRWVVRLAIHLLLFLSIGAACSIVLLVVWMVALNHATNEIKQSQEANRIIIENNQKVILDNQKALIKTIEQKSQ